MDQQFTDYLESLITQCLASAKFANLSEGEKQAKAAEIRDYLNNLIFRTLVDNLDDTQVEELNNLSSNPDDLEKKIEEFSAGIPNLASEIEQKLLESASYIEANGQFPSHNNS